MKQTKKGVLTKPILGFLFLWAGQAPADISLGPDPYIKGLGFDRPHEAKWGGWRRGADGTLYAEWDVFNDASHGGKDDRTAAPDLGKSGVRSAWLGWNAGTFISSTMNLYSFSVPEIIRVNIAGTPTAGPTRVALQVESQGDGSLMAKSLRLNGRGPAIVAQTFKGTYPSSMGPSELIHQVALWDLAEAPDKYEIDFTAPQHTTIRQVAVDIGPSQGGLTPVAPNQPETSSAIINLAAEELDAEKVVSLFAQNRRYFPQVWAASRLSFKQTSTPRPAGTQLRRQLSGSIKALYYDEAAQEGSNRVLIDVYRRGEMADVKIAECELKPTQLKRWAKVTLNDQEKRLGTAVYKLNLQGVHMEGQPETGKLSKRVGQCDIDLNTEGVQPGIPSIKEGDYTTFRRGNP
jgi:hypothetical protein